MDFLVAYSPVALYYASLIAVPLAMATFLAHAWKQRDYRARKLPSYDEIPADILRQVASKKTLEGLSGNIDIAVVGSGIGALSSAALLSRCGYKVVVFEQHKVAGGSTHTFSHQGYEFDVGVHYVGGQLDKRGSTLRAAFDTLSDGQLQWSRLDENYDVMYNASSGEQLEVTGDPKVNRKRLLTHFTDLDPAVLDRYYRACFWSRNVAVVALTLKGLPPFFLRLIWPFFGPVYRHFCLRKTIHVMRKCDLPEDVIGALTYNYGDYATTPGRSPFFMQALLESHYHGGGFFPKGGSSSIAKTLVAAINRRGGQVFVLSKVETILTEKTWMGGHRAVGVRVHGVDIMVKKCVISDAGFNNTFGDLGTTSSKVEAIPLVNDAEASAAQLALLHKDGEGSLHPSPAFFLLAVGLDASDKDLNIPAQNVWHFEHWRHDEYMDRVLHEEKWKDALKDVPLVFLSNESAKDPDYQKRHPGKSTVTIVAFSKYEWVKAWSDASDHHCINYEDMKGKMTRRLLEILYKHYPQTEGHVVFTEMGSPLTVNKYLGRQTGEIYNLDHTSERYSTLGAQLALHPETTVKNLYMTGQDVSSVSVMVCTLTGYLAAGRASPFAMAYYCVPTLLSLYLPFMLGK